MAVLSKRHCFCSKTARITALIIKNIEKLPIIVNIFFVGFYPPINLHFSKKTSKHGISRSKTVLNSGKTLKCRKSWLFFQSQSHKKREFHYNLRIFLYIFRPAPIYGILWANKYHREQKSYIFYNYPNQKRAIHFCLDNPFFLPLIIGYAFRGEFVGENYTLRQ